MVLIGWMHQAAFPNYRLIMNRIVLGRDSNLTSQVTQRDTIYVVKRDYDLGRETVHIPSGCILEFQGGSISNGIMVFNDACLKTGKGCDMDDGLSPLPVIEKIHELAANNKPLTCPYWGELLDEMRPRMPRFFEKIDGFGMKEKSKGYKLCVLTRLEFSLSEICSLLSMSSQALNVMRRRLSVKCFAGEGSAREFDEMILKMPA